MNGDQGWKARFEQELRQAESARARENEGMARVCSRRAAGIVVGEYFHRAGLPEPGPSAYDRLRFFQTLPGIHPDLQEIAAHFLLRITVDHELPVEADLIAEARLLAEKLLEYENG